MDQSTNKSCRSESSLSFRLLILVCLYALGKHAFVWLGFYLKVCVSYARFMCFVGVLALVFLFFKVHNKKCSIALKGPIFSLSQ